MKPVFYAILLASISAPIVFGQTFSHRTIDTSLLPDLMPGQNVCLDRKMLGTHVCEPVAALVQSIQPPPPGERAVLLASDVLQLCGAHNLRDVVCGAAALLELKYHSVPCWNQNRC